MPSVGTALPDYRFDRFTLRVTERQLLADGGEIPLGARAFDVLVVLVERAGKLVTKDELFERAWPGVVVEENNLQVQIGTLRKALGAKAIATIPGRGYRFTFSLVSDTEPLPDNPADLSTDNGSEVAEQQRRTISGHVEPSEVAPEGMAASSSTTPSIAPTPARHTHVRPWFMPVLMAAMAIAFLAGAWLWLREETPVHRIVANPNTPLTDNKAIAVLPFTNMSDDKDTAYFADGVHEDLLTQLALLGELKVVSRTSVAEYRNSNKNVRQIGSELGVASLVEGSVRRSGNRVRVTAQLIDVRTDKHLWGSSYDRELKDIFAIQSELATEIAKALRITLAPQEQSRLAKRPTDNLEAYDLFLRAQDLYNRSQGTIRVFASINDRIALLSKAVYLDPKFALAWARLAAEHGRAYVSAVDMTAGRQAQAKTAMDRALNLAPEDLHVKIEEGNYFRMALADYDRAAQAFEKVLRVAPHNVDALNGLASVYSFQDRVAERMKLLERALVVEPRNFGALGRLANDYLAYRHYDRALAYRQETINIRPDDITLQAERSRIEYYRSGTWTAYDKWRATLPEGAVRMYLSVRIMDLNRAIAKRDYAEVLRLADVESEDARGFIDSSQSGILKNGLIALALRAKGDRVQAMESARAGLRLADNEIRNRPKDSESWYLKAWLHAVLGERGLAVATHARAVAVAREEGGDVVADWIQRTSLGLHALLGNRKEALAEASRQLKLPYSHVHEMRASVELAALWDDPQFQAMMNDPTNNAPLPISNKQFQAPQK